MCLQLKTNKIKWKRDLPCSYKFLLVPDMPDSYVSSRPWRVPHGHGNRLTQSWTFQGPTTKIKDESLFLMDYYKQHQSKEELLRFISFRKPKADAPQALVQRQLWISVLVLHITWLCWWNHSSFSNTIGSKVRSWNQKHFYIPILGSMPWMVNASNHSLIYAVFNLITPNCPLSWVSFSDS